MKQISKSLFKLQPPQDLISRMFILEYIRELGVSKVKEKLTKGESQFWVYAYGSDQNEKEYDFNWEYLMFTIPLSNLSNIMERYLDDIEALDNNRKLEYNKMREAKLEQEINTPVEINLYDLARADIKGQSTKLT